MSSVPLRQVQEGATLLSIVVRCLSLYLCTDVTWFVDEAVDVAEKFGDKLWLKLHSLYEKAKEVADDEHRWAKSIKKSMVAAPELHPRHRGICLRGIEFS